MACQNRLSGSIGEFGNYSVQGETSRPGQLYSQVYIEADVVAPPIGGPPREAVANFIIDGGNVNFIAGPNSELTLLLTLATDVPSSRTFQSGFELTSGQTGLPSFSPIGGVALCTRRRQ